MTINVLFKIPDAVVFATDGMASLLEPHPAQGEDRIIASVADVEKLLVLSDGSPRGRSCPVLAMFNGVGTLGNGTIASELARFDQGGTPGSGRRRPTETVQEYATRLNQHLRDAEEAQTRRTGMPPRPFHLILAGFDPPWPTRMPPQVYQIKWARGAPAPPTPWAVLHDGSGESLSDHQYGSFCAGLTESPARIVDGFDQDLPLKTTRILAGLGTPAAPPGLLEQLIHDARREAPAAPALSNQAVEELVMKYTKLILSELFQTGGAPLAESFSTQAAINYCVFLAFAAYVGENWSPTRSMPPRIGHPLQVACLPRNGAVQLLRRVRLDVNLTEFSRGAA